jgi:hypothetical protein
LKHATSSSLTDEKRVCSLLLSTARGAIRFESSARVRSIPRSE